MFGKMNKDFIKYSRCRFCNSKNIVKTIDLGKMPLAGGFLKANDIKKEKKYPLNLNFCKDCYLLQTNISINPDRLFKRYFYFSSKIKTLVIHFQKTSKKLTKMLDKNSFILEIGCNDGEFIKAAQENKFRVLGVDPASNVVKPLIKKGMPIINSYFTEKLAKKIVEKHGQADAIISFHSLAHIPDMVDVARGIKLLLKDDGFLSFEVHYLGDLLKEHQYDMIYHEHLHYYSLITLKKFFEQFGMEIFNVEFHNIRAGSITYFVQHKNTGKRKINKKVKELATKERVLGFNTPRPYIAFNKNIQANKKEIFTLLKNLKAKKYKIAGYGASGRGTVIANFCNLSPKLLEFVVDDSPAKQGFMMPGTHNMIFSPLELVKRKIDFAILFAWPFIKEVRKNNKLYIRRGGKFILPLPKVTIQK